MGKPIKISIPSPCHEDWRLMTFVHRMHKLGATIFTIVLTLIKTDSVIAQERIITGTVYDETGPLPGAIVLIQGTTRGVSTDIEGQYHILAGQGEILIFSFQGYVTEKAEINEKNVVDVTLDYDPDTYICAYPKIKRTFFGRMLHSIGNIFRKNE